MCTHCRVSSRRRSRVGGTRLGAAHVGSGPREKPPLSAEAFRGWLTAFFFLFYFIIQRRGDDNWTYARGGRRPLSAGAKRAGPTVSEERRPFLAPPPGPGKLCARETVSKPKLRNANVRTCRNKPDNTYGFYTRVILSPRNRTFANFAIFFLYLFFIHIFVDTTCRVANHNRDVRGVDGGLASKIVPFRVFVWFALLWIVIHNPKNSTKRPPAIRALCTAVWVFSIRIV